MCLSHISENEYFLKLFLPFSLDMFDVIIIIIFDHSIFNVENLIAINSEKLWYVWTTLLPRDPMAFPVKFNDGNSNLGQNCSVNASSNCVVNFDYLSFD